MLDVIDKGTCSGSHPVPLLFVHGAWSSAWYWDEHFLAFFADKGYRVVAVSLRGHGNSSAPKRLRACSLADYVDDVAAVAESLPARPVVIGHSMGGAIVQKYLESHDAPAGVLMASVPPRGLRALMLRLARKYPWLTVKSALVGDTTGPIKTPARAREQLFTPDAPESLVVDCVRRVQQESKRVLYLDLLISNLPKPERVTTPILVLGAELDGIFTIEEVRATARAYRTEAELFPGMGHMLMLEPGWATVAERIHVWLESRCLQVDFGGADEQAVSQ